MKAFILVGYPGSGKSTWAKERSAVIINRDSLRTMIYGKYSFKTEDELLIREMSESCAWAAMNHSRDIIIDDTNLTIGTRAKWIESFKRMDYRVTFVYFQTDMETCISRRGVEGKGFSEEYWRKIINGMSTIFTSPSVKEGADELIVV